MCRTLSSWRLYSWIRLIWLSKIESGSTTSPEVAFSQPAKASLGRALRLAKLLAEAGVLGQRQQFAQLRQVGDPSSPIVRVMSADKAGFACCSQRRGVTPLVLLLKRSGIQLGEVAQHVLAQQLRVNRRDAVGAVRADHCQMRHAHPPRRRLSSIRLTRCTRASSPG